MSWEDLRIEGYVAGPSENMKIYRSLVAPGYFDLMRIPLAEGPTLPTRRRRNAAGHDRQPGVCAPLPAAPESHRTQGEWLGRRFTIVGVVGTGKYITFTESPRPYFYIPIRQYYMPEIKFYVRMGGVGKSRWHRAAGGGSHRPERGHVGGEALTEHIGAALFGQKLAASLMSGMGAIAMLLAAIGLYSAMAYSAIQLIYEIGFRIALGARPLDMTWLALRRGMMLTMAGLAIGLAAAIAMARWHRPC